MDTATKDGTASGSRNLKPRITIQSQKLEPLKTSTQSTTTFHLGEETVGGFSAGVVGTLLGFPLDLAKTRMQTQRTSGKARSTISLLSHILKTEGIKSLYKGVGPPLLSLSIVNTFSFTSYSYFRQNHFHGTSGWDYNNALSGMMGAPVFGIVTTPENFLKTQMQLDNVQSGGGKKFLNSFQCAKMLVSSHGFPVLYTGHVINTVREAAFVGTYFFCYEGYKCEFQKLLSRLEHFISAEEDGQSEINHDTSWSKSFAIPMAGGCAGATAWFSTFPLDCVRAGVQGQLITETQRKKQGALETLKQLLRTKGITGLYAGVAPSIARAFLVSGSRFSAYEGAIWLCRWSGLTSGDDCIQLCDERPDAFDD